MVKIKGFSIEKNDTDPRVSPQTEPQTYLLNTRLNVEDMPYRDLLNKLVEISDRDVFFIGCYRGTDPITDKMALNPYIKREAVIGNAAGIFKWSNNDTHNYVVHEGREVKEITKQEADARIFNYNQEASLQEKTQQRTTEKAESTLVNPDN